MLLSILLQLRGIIHLMRGDYPTLMWGMFFKGSIGLLLALLLCILWVSGAKAVAPPTTMSFQGRLTNTAGNIVADGQYNMVFAIYSVSSGGSSLWTETRETTNRVTVTNGLFSVRLGEVTPLTASIFSSNSSLYFGIQIATPATATCSTAACATFETEMTPRSQLATSAYSFNATNAEDATNLGGVAATNYARKDAANTFTQTNTFNNTATFNGGATIDTFSGGTWINMPTTGPSAIGTGGAGSNAWIGYAAGAGNYFSDAAAGDLAYRNTSGRILLGNSSGHSQVALSSNNITFNPLADTVNAFQIQNAANSPFFTVDTSASMKIQVGSSTPDANGIQFVLDSSSAEPTGVAGGIYYNSTNNRMRCYEASAWRNCINGYTLVKTADQAVTNSTVFVDEPDLQIPLESNGYYTFTAALPYNPTSTTADMKMAFVASTATALRITAIAPPTSGAASTAPMVCSMVTSGTSCVFNVTGGGANTMNVTGYVQNGASAGTLKFQFAQSVQTVGQSVTFYKGGSLSYQKTQ